MVVARMGAQGRGDRGGLQLEGAPDDHRCSRGDPRKNLHMLAVPFP